MGLIESQKFTQLKKKIIAECKRRKYVGSVNTSPYTDNYTPPAPAQNKLIGLNHIAELIEPLSAINPKDLMYKFYAVGVAYAIGDIIINKDTNNYYYYRVLEGISATANTGWNAISNKLEIADHLVLESELNKIDEIVTNFSKKKIGPDEPYVKSNDCASSCTGGCYTTCSSGCGNNCTGDCYTGCTNACAGGCASGCTGGCKGCTGCGSGCANQCGGNCTAACANTCSVYCRGECESTCTGCGTDCKVDCIHICYQNCEGYCSTVCGDSCEKGCGSGCVNSCVDGCVSSCSGCTGCGGSCSITCGGGQYNDPDHTAPWW